MKIVAADQAGVRGNTLLAAPVGGGGELVGGYKKGKVGNVVGFLYCIN